MSAPGGPSAAAGHPGGGARRAGRRRGAHGRARPSIGRLLSRRQTLGVGGLLRGGHAIRAPGTFREVLSEVALVALPAQPEAVLEPLTPDVGLSGCSANRPTK